MSTSKAPAITDSTERLTWSEICEPYPDDTDREFETALVLGHFKRRREASPQIKSVFEHHEDVSCLWTGKIRGPIPRFIIP